MEKMGDIDEGIAFIEKAYAILNAIEDAKLIGDLEKEVAHYLSV